MAKFLTNSTTTNRVAPSNERIEVESIDEVDDCNDFPKSFLPTLPPVFKKLLGKPINIDIEEPRQTIELERCEREQREKLNRVDFFSFRSLGGALGVTDYQTSMPAFWFLDTLADQLARHKKNLDGYYTSVLISWLAGEMKLIQDRQYLREEFFREMKGMFTEAANGISRSHRLSFWDEILYTDAEGEMETLPPPSRSQESLQKEFSQASIEPSGIVDPNSVLDIVVECTYDMYANEFRYALVYAVFVQPVEVQVYNLPFVLRKPRPIKMPAPKALPIPAKLHKNLKKIGDLEKSKKFIRETKSKEKLNLGTGLPTTPPSSLDDEKLLLCNRMFILPLVESHEASEMFLACTNIVM